MSSFPMPMKKKQRTKEQPEQTDRRITRSMTQEQQQLKLQLDRALEIFAPQSDIEAYKAEYPIEEQTDIEANKADFILYVERFEKELNKNECPVDDFSQNSFLSACSQEFEDAEPNPICDRASWTDDMQFLAEINSAFDMINVAELDNDIQEISENITAAATSEPQKKKVDDKDEVDVVAEHNKVDNDIQKISEDITTAESTNIKEAVVIDILKKISKLIFRILKTLASGIEETYETKLRFRIALLIVFALYLTNSTCSTVINFTASKIFGLITIVLKNTDGGKKIIAFIEGIQQTIQLVSTTVQDIIEFIREIKDDIKDFKDFVKGLDISKEDFIMILTNLANLGNAATESGTKVVVDKITGLLAGPAAQLLINFLTPQPNGLNLLGPSGGKKLTKKRHRNTNKKRNNKKKHNTNKKRKMGKKKR